MANTSATGGYLTASTSPISDTTLEDLLHDVVVGITGLGATLVRPRWQPEPPKQPAATVNWCSPGILTRTRQGYPAYMHNPVGLGTDNAYSWEEIELMASFYGPNAFDYAVNLRDGITVEQNRAVMNAAGVKVASVGQARNVPEKINNTWVRRVDLDLTLNIENRRVYPVLNLVCGTVTIYSDTGLTFVSNP